MKKFILILMATFTFSVFTSCREETETEEVELNEEVEEVGSEIEEEAETDY